MRLSRRRFEQDDIPLIRSWLPSFEATIQWGGPFFDFPVTDESLLELIAQHEGEGPVRECWMVDEDGRGSIGHFQLGFEPRSGQATLGRVLIAPEHRGRGLSHPLVEMAIAQAFARDWVHRLELRVYEFNAPAIATYRKAGFVLEGVRRDAIRVGDAYWNSAVMGLLRRERE